jgi:hypothetical protein
LPYVVPSTFNGSSYSFVIKGYLSAMVFLLSDIVGDA